jgi:RecA/RadA recombinase
LLLYCREAGNLIEVAGEKGSGKTSLLHMLCTINTLENKRTLYLDGSGSFRPEKIRDHLEESYRFKKEEIIEYLRNISFVRIYESDNIFNLLRKIKLLNIDYIVIDDLMILFLNNHRSKVRFQVRRFVREMALIVLLKRISIIFTNTIIRKSDNDNSHPFLYELFYNDLVRYVHVKALLQKSATNVIDFNIIYPTKLNSSKFESRFGCGYTQ